MEGTHPHPYLRHHLVSLAVLLAGSHHLLHQVPQVGRQVIFGAPRLALRAQRGHHLWHGAQHAVAAVPADRVVQAAQVMVAG
mgnify:CR=1 FL=1